MNKAEVLIAINRVIESHLFEDADGLLDTYDFNEQIYTLMSKHFADVACDIVDEHTRQREDSCEDSGYNMALNDIEEAIRKALTQEKENDNT